MTPLLTYTPPLQRDLVAPHLRSTFPRYFTSPNVYPDDIDYAFEIDRDPDNNCPFVSVCTAPVEAWKSGEEDDYTTIIYFRNRTEWLAAWRLARRIKRTPDAIWLPKEDWMSMARVEAAPEHGIRVITDWAFL